MGRWPRRDAALAMLEKILWDLETGRVLRTLDGHGAWIISTDFNTLKMWDLETGCVLRLYVANSAFREEQRTLVWVDRKGAAQAVPAPTRGYVSPRISPDGGRVAVQVP